MFALFLIVFFAYRCLSLDKECRLLQLNHYQLSRSVKHVVSSFHITQYKLLRFVLHLPFILLFFSNQSQFELFTLMLIVYFYLTYKVNTAMKRKVNLVYTKRMLRLYTALFILYSLLLMFFYHSSYFLLFSLLLMMCNPCMVLLAACIMHPIEKAIASFYVALAKRTLKENTQLIKLGIVGSYGKTSTKNIVYAFLSQRYYCLKSKKSYNNLMGNTLMIRNDLKKVHEVMIAEMGSDHVGEIKKLMQFIEPGYVILTSIGNQHLETFKTQENIIREKTSPLLYLKRNDIAFINIDNPYLYANKTLGVARKIYFGENQEADYRLCDIVMNEHGSQFAIIYKQEKIPFKTILLGYYNIMNIVGSIAAAHTLGVSFTQIQKALEELKPIEHRLQSIQKSHYTLIDNAYNSNVKSFKNSLQVLKRIKKYRILITPGLIDLKNDREINNQMMDEIQDNVDEIIIVGYLNRAALCDGLKRNHFTAYSIVDTMEEALAYIENLKRDDFVALIENDIDKDYMNAN